MSQTKTKTPRATAKKTGAKKGIGKPIKIPGGATIYTPKQYMQAKDLGLLPKSKTLKSAEAMFRNSKVKGSDIFRDQLGLLEKLGLEDAPASPANGPGKR